MQYGAGTEALHGLLSFLEINLKFLKLQLYYWEWMPVMYFVIPCSWRSVLELQRNRNFEEPIHIRTTLVFFRKEINFHEIFANFSGFHLLFNL